MLSERPGIEPSTVAIVRAQRPPPTTDIFIAIALPVDIDFGNPSHEFDGSGDIGKTTPLPTGQIFDKKAAMGNVLNLKGLIRF
jgi:hypothetical protein